MEGHVWRSLVAIIVPVMEAMWEFTVRSLHVTPILVFMEGHVWRSLVAIIVPVMEAMWEFTVRSLHVTPILVFMEGHVWRSLVAIIVPVMEAMWEFTVRSLFVQTDGCMEERSVFWKWLADYPTGLVRVTIVTVWTRLYSETETELDHLYSS
ncbi:uncharacterized protein LOC121416585 [Lytechinus variegatus]|uniref:uncharacterized protein LOC121416585 n=1 Tax=Lytechinus variegatus TaxID=7654 RepID=UPI001BB26827|nr:uncharacterized protein LOC121416585 [Lytechinus variegatus]